MYPSSTSSLIINLWFQFLIISNLKLRKPKLLTISLIKNKRKFDWWLNLNWIMKSWIDQRLNKWMNLNSASILDPIIDYKQNHVSINWKICHFRPNWTGNSVHFRPLTGRILKSTFSVAIEEELAITVGDIFDGENDVLSRCRALRHQIAASARPLLQHGRHCGRTRTPRNSITFHSVKCPTWLLLPLPLPRPVSCYFKQSKCCCSGRRQWIMLMISRGTVWKVDCCHVKQVNN